MSACHIGRQAGLRILLTILGISIASAAATAQPPLPGGPPAQGRLSNRNLGLWQWTVNRNLVMTLRLQRDGNKLTGVLIGGDGPGIEIEDGRFDDGVLSFKVSKALEKGEVTTEYIGIFAGNVINGGMRVYFGERPKNLPGYMSWQARRVKPAPRDSNQRLPRVD
jgi:hypothetical protein